MKGTSGRHRIMLKGRYWRRGLGVESAPQAMAFQVPESPPRRFV